jgi:tripartite-type tricarboxylate transporter receptor subunit TctC
MVKRTRRKFLRLVAGVTALPYAPHVARAQAYPNKLVHWIVPYPPGGPTDILARLLGQRLNERLGQPFIVENKPGASSNIGTEMVAKSAPDGYTLLLVAGANAINATLFERLNFNFIRDLAPVIGIIRSPLVLETNPSKPFKTVNELVAYAKANPGKVNMASAGMGTPQHMSLELFKMLAGVQVNHIPYRGAAPAVTDLLGGQVDVMFDSLPASLEHIKAGRFRALAVASSSRIDMLPDISPLSESLPGYESSAWYGVATRAGVSPDIIAKLNNEINLAFREPRIKSRLAELGYVMGGSPTDFGKHIADETEKWGKVIKSAGIKPE